MLQHYSMQSSVHTSTLIVAKRTAVARLHTAVGHPQLRLQQSLQLHVPLPTQPPWRRHAREQLVQHPGQRSMPSRQPSTVQ